MPALRKDLRSQLENTVLDARAAAEAGGREALVNLGVDAGKAPDHLKPSDKALRNRLRACGRQAGDVLDERTDRQTLEHLVGVVAYEHWHRMLFARFLAENGLLLEPQHQVAVSLADVAELARDAGTDIWHLAGRYAQHMLPAVFRPDDPVLALTLAPEDQKALEKLVAGLSPEVFIAEDSLGWTYQFWQARRKKEVNDSGNKIGADELPSVTQLFTEDYMVDFLLDNTLGAWWAGKQMSEARCQRPVPKTEEEAREAVAIPGCPWQYLRFTQSTEPQSKVQTPNSKIAWVPAAGTFGGWPKTAKELKCLDPCMGSGHFVVAMFQRLVALRMAEENLDEAAAVAAVISDNLFGLEIDPRCTQIAAFNLALAAWRRVGHCKLPAMNLACSGLAPNTREADWLALAGQDERVQNGMARLYRLFKNAPMLGSLINPRSAEDGLLEAPFHELKPLLEKALAHEKDVNNPKSIEMAVTARGLTKAVEILAAQFTLVATNVPFLTQSKFSAELKGHIYSYLELAKENLSSAFSFRMIGLTAKDGVTAFVSPQSWWFLKRYTDYRKSLLEHQTIRTLYRLGEGAFQSPQAGGELVGLSIIQNSEPTSDAEMLLADASSGKAPFDKALMLQTVRGVAVRYEDVLDSVDIAYRPPANNGGKIGHIASVLQGLVTGDSAQYFGKFWERSKNGSEWEFLQSTSTQTTYFGGLTDVILWENEHGRLAALAESVKGINHSAQNWRKGKPNWGKPGVVVSQMGNFPSTLYLGNIYDHNCCAIVPNDDSDVVPLWSFCSSEMFAKSVKAINQNRKIEVGTVLNTDYDLAYWKKVASEKYPHGLPKPFSSNPTQWLFNGHPAGADQPLHVALARLLGYQWPRQTGSSFPDCPALGPDGLEEHADEDGIVCLAPVRDERAAADRLRALLSAALGHYDEHGLIASTGSKARTLEDWLCDEAFEQHCKLFQHRPFIWHIWDGRPDGFHALVNYHKLAAPDGGGRKLLETLVFSYLGDWMRKQQDDAKRNLPGAEDRMLAAQFLQRELQAILAGEPPYDLFIRWKPLSAQPIGWEPDLNDGVELNIRPFLLAKDVGRRGTGILRYRPTSIQWEKDRGKEPERAKADFPWFWGWDEQSQDFAGGADFDGNRWNGCHYTTKSKHASPERHGPRR